MLFLDTECCGFHGVAVLIQYAEGDGEIHLHDVWMHNAQENIELLEWIASKEVCGFNLTFDWFHIQKLYNMLKEYVASPMYDPEVQLQYVIEDMAAVEPYARDGECIKPKSACDLMLHARRGPYQSTMDRRDIVIKRVPAMLADLLAKELDRRLPLPDIYFARRKKKTDGNWQIQDVFEERDGAKVLVKDFRNVVLRFAPSSGLKALAVDLGIKGKDEVHLIGEDIGVAKQYTPKELGHAPFAKAAGKGAWPDVLDHHISYWGYNPLGREYARDDIVITREVWKRFDRPDPGDNDSILACAVGSMRWKGFAIDLDGITARRDEILKVAKDVPVAPGPARRWLEQELTATELIGLGGSTAAPILEEVSGWTLPCNCEFTSSYDPRTRMIKFTTPDGFEHSVAEDDEAQVKKVIMVAECPRCKGTKEYPHPAAEKAQKILAARKALKEVEVFDKLLEAGRFHASFTIIGTRSNRMSGSTTVEGGKERAATLNPQGIKNHPEVRKLFPLAHSGMELGGGDFDAFEVSIAEAVYNDPKLREALLSGKKIHALFAQELYKGASYEDVIATKGVSHGMYDNGKHCVFSLMYGGDENTLVNRYGIDPELAHKGTENFLTTYKGVREEQQRNYDQFCSMRQPNGIGSKVEWHEPAEYVESMLGFRRYFTLENQICRTLFELAENPPKPWLELKIKVVRRDRLQFAGNAVRSALFAAAFGMQSYNMRAAGNHKIQSPGGEITKDVQCGIWELQPSGVAPWVVMPFNVHDEVMCPHDPMVKQHVNNIVDSRVERYRPKIPLISMEWCPTMQNWAEK